jgi:hypothetical protein
VIPLSGISTDMKKRKKKRRRSADEGGYVCPTCGEQIVIPLDRSAGLEQQYVEDCPICCNPNVVHVELLGDSESPRVWAEAE